MQSHVRPVHETAQASSSYLLELSGLKDAELIKDSAFPPPLLDTVNLSIFTV